MDAPEPIRDLLTAGTVARWLGVAACTVRAWCVRGEIEAVNVGTWDRPQWRIPRRAVLARCRRSRPFVP